MNLTLLAPEIQESLLFLPSAEHGRERVHEKKLRPVAAEMDWSKQRDLWKAILGAIEKAE